MDKIISILLMLTLALLLAYPVGVLYAFLFSIVPGFSGFLIPEGVSRFIQGLPSSFLFSAALIFTLFAKRHRYTWLIAVVFVVLVFELYVGAPRIYFSILIGVVGWLLAQGILYVRGRFGQKAAA